jgi:eukaryotic-like serine/threonine-protein kinase
VTQAAGPKSPQLAALARLLDEALDQPTAARAGWLQAVAERAPEHHAPLLKLLASHEAAEAEDFLNRTLSVELLAQGHDAPATPHLGPYRLLRKLGDGGMSSVWLAERADGQFDGQVAIKLLPPALASHAGFRERLQHEAQVLAKLSHPHIAKLLDAGIATSVGAWGDTPYLVLELVQGQSITVHCDERKLDVPARLRLMLQVCDAVGYLHGNLVIHRDIKPSNVMVDASGTVKLVDFGIAKLMGEAIGAGDLTVAHGGAFTPDYAAPEQMQGKALTTAADVYSLGAVLYRLFTGVQPPGTHATGPHSRPSALFSATSTLPQDQRETLANQRGLSAQRLERLMRDELDVVILKALAPNPEDRYPNAVSLASDLQAYLAGQPVSAKRPTFGYMTRKFAARHRAGVLTGLLTLLCIVGLSGVSLWQAQRAAAEAARTQKVLTFITELLGKSNPNATDGKRITVAELLKGGLPDAQARFQNDPAAHKQVLRAMADVLQATNDLNEVAAILKAQWLYARERFGDMSIEAAEAEADFGRALARATKFEEAIETLKQALGKFETLKRPLDQQHLQAATMLATVLKTVDRFDEARLAATQAQGVYARLRAPTDNERAEHAISMLQLFTFDATERERWLDIVEREQSFDQLTNVLRRATGKLLYARTLRDIGKAKQAVVAYRQALADVARIAGEQSFMAEVTEGELGAAETDMMLVNDARPRLQRAVDMGARSGRAAERNFVTQDLAKLGTLEMRALNDVAARGYLQRARDAIRDSGAKATPTYLQFETQMAILDGQWSRASAYAAQLRTMVAARGTQGNVAVLVADSLLATVKRLEGDTMSAFQTCTQVLAQYQAMLPREGMQHVRSKGCVAQALVDLGRHQEAATLGEQAARVSADMLGLDHPLTAQVQYIQAQALDKLGQRERAAALMQQAQATFQAKLGKPLDERLMRVLY